MNDSDTATRSLHPNHRYLIQWMRETCTNGGTALDYGCGDGKVVMAARAAGIDAHGAETYYDGMRTQDIDATREADPAARYIHTITNNRMDFPDANFDIVTANMVFEHVHDLGGTLREIHRVLKPDGLLLSLFPTIGALREGHLSMPFIHWLPRNRFRRLYARAMRKAGIFSDVWGSDPAWVDRALAFLDDHVCYRSQRQVLRLMSPLFTVRRLEPEWLAFRVRKARTLLRVPGGRLVAHAVVALGAGMVILGRKIPSQSPQPG